MKQKKLMLSRRYAAALRRHLKPGANNSVKAALGLGRQAVMLGMKTLELARIHDEALASLPFVKGKTWLIKRAEIFFTEATMPIEETRRGSRHSRTQLRQMDEALNQRTLELAATHRQLQRDVVRRKIMEDAAEKAGRHYKKCLEESLQLQERLQHLTHRVMAAQENERKTISHELQDEIAQTLLGINVRLLSLKREARRNTEGLKNEIDNTQRLVVRSVKSVRRAARKIGGK